MHEQKAVYSNPNVGSFGELATTAIEEADLRATTPITLVKIFFNQMKEVCSRIQVSLANRPAFLQSFLVDHAWSIVDHRFVNHHPVWFQAWIVVLGRPACWSMIEVQM